MHELIEYITEYRMQYAKLVVENLRPEVMFTHDDWGTKEMCIRDRKNGRATLTGTDTLAGSSIHLMDGLRRSVSFGVPLEAAVYAATEAPAKTIRRSDIGRLAVGCCADLVLLDSQLNLKAVFIDGQRIS